MFMAKKIVVCCSINDQYTWPWLVMAYSAKLNSINPVSFIVANVNLGLTENMMRRLVQVCEHLSIEMRIVELKISAKLKTTSQPLNVYAKMHFLDCLDSEFLWIDADCLLLQNWQEILEYEEILKENLNLVIAAAADEEQSNVASTNMAMSNLDHTYFNSGIFLAIPARWRKAGLDREWISTGENHQQLGFEYQDQDVLNYLLNGKIAELPQKFNVLRGNHFEANSRILHFTGKPKPWAFSGSSRQYYAAKVILNPSRLGREFNPGVNWIEKFCHYWIYEDSLISAISDCVGLEGCKFDFFDINQIVFLSKADKFKLLILKIFAATWK